MNNEWSSLDLDALANLGQKGISDFIKYKEQLKNDGHSWDEAEEILRGYIWDESEECCEED